MKIFQTTILSHTIGRDKSTVTLEIPKELSVLLINTDPEPRLVLSLKDEQTMNSMGHEVPGDPDYEDEVEVEVEVKKPLLTVVADDFFRSLSLGRFKENIEYEIFKTVIVFKPGIEEINEVELAAFRQANLSYVKIDGYRYKVGLFSDLVAELNGAE